MSIAASLTVKVLDRSDARPSFPLARAVFPGLTLRNWARRLARADSRRRALVGVLNPGGCFVALMLVSGGEAAALAVSPLCRSVEPQLRHLAAICANTRTA